MYNVFILIYNKNVITKGYKMYTLDNETINQYEFDFIDETSMKEFVKTAFGLDLPCYTNSESSIMIKGTPYQVFNLIQEKYDSTITPEEMEEANNVYNN